MLFVKVLAKKPTDGSKSTDILDIFLKAISKTITFPIKPVDSRQIKVTRHEKDFLEEVLLFK